MISQVGALVGREKDVDEEAMPTETTPRVYLLMSGVAFQEILLFTLACPRRERGCLRALVFYLFSAAKRGGWGYAWDQPVTGHRPSNNTHHVSLSTPGVGVRPFGGMRGECRAYGGQGDDDSWGSGSTASEHHRSPGTREEEQCVLRFWLGRKTHHETLSVHPPVNQAKT